MFGWLNVIGHIVFAVMTHIYHNFNYWQCSNTESVRVGRFLKLLIRGSCVSLSVCLSVIRKTLFFTTKEVQKNVAKIRKIFSIYTILLF